MATFNDTSDPLQGSPRPPQQFAMLDMVIPGFSVFSSAVHAYLGVDLNIYIPIIFLLCGVSWCWSYMYQTACDLIRKHLMCSARIRTDDEIFNMVMGWVAAQKFSQNSRRFIANTNLNSKIWFLWRLWADDDDEDEDGEWRGVTPATKKKQLQYTPSFGQHFFWFRGRPLVFERSENRDANMGSLLASEKEEIYISCFGRSPALIKELLLEARQKHMAKDEHKTIIYRGATDGRGGEMDWKRCMARSARPFSTVILNKEVKDELIADVEDYLNPATRRWYANRGIPYRRGYLLYGPPGTGKSSLSLALAGHFKMRIYILSLSSPMATEENVASLFSSLPRRCVVLLEDIDSAGLTHTRENASNTTTNEEPPPVVAPPPPGSKTTSPLTGRLSLSGLLNILDGVASQEGRVLIMTTNHLEKLDKALIRPGRVDMTVEFGRADSFMSASIFRAIYSPYDGESTPKIGLKKSLSSDSLESIQKNTLDVPIPAEKYSEAKGPLSPEEQAAKEAREARAAAERQEATAKVDELANTFASKIPEHEFSPAEIQGLLLKHKRDPLAAIADVDSWIERTRKEKAEKEIRDAEERRKKEKEEAKKKRKEERKKAKKKARKAQGKKKGDKKKGKEEDDSGSGTDSESESESDSEAEAGSETKTLKGEAQQEKSDDTAEKSEEQTEEKTENKKEEKKGHEKKPSSDSGYGTP